MFAYHFVWTKVKDWERKTIDSKIYNWDMLNNCFVCTFVTPNRDSTMHHLLRHSLISKWQYGNQSGSANPTLFLNKNGRGSRPISFCEILCPILCLNRTSPFGLGFTLIFKFYPQKCTILPSL